LRAVPPDSGEAVCLELEAHRDCIRIRGILLLETPRLCVDAELARPPVGQMTLTSAHS